MREVDLFDVANPCPQYNNGSTVHHVMLLIESLEIILIIMVSLMVAMVMLVMVVVLMSLVMFVVFFDENAAGDVFDALMIITICIYVYSTTGSF